MAGAPRDAGRARRVAEVRVEAGGARVPGRRSPGVGGCPRLTPWEGGTSKWVFVGACLKLRNFEDFSGTCKHNAQLCLPEILKAESRGDSWVTSDYWDPKGPNFCVWRCEPWGVCVYAVSGTTRGKFVIKDTFCSLPPPLQRWKFLVKYLSS